MGMRGPKPKGKVSIEWSPDLAYAVGLITADGNLSKDGRHIIFTSKDYDLSETFAKCLGLKNKIGYKSSGYGIGKIYSVIQFGDIVFYRWLQSIGLTPKKSKTISSLNIPENVFFDFLRGLFDGDGCIYSYWDPRWHSSFMFYLGFTSGSDAFIAWLRLRLRQILSINGQIANGTRATTLRFAKAESLKIIEKMYYNTSVPKLDRKYQKILKILATENDHSPDSRTPVI